MTALLCLAFFLSGCAALLFETLWFRQAGLLLGNSVWASSVVLGSFMAGLALGNGLAARRSLRQAQRIPAYAALEAVIAVTGIALVLLLPRLTPLLAPLLGTLAPWPGLLNAVRGLIAFLLLLAPATAMGATLPILAAALSHDDRQFGRTLGALYGWNTLGGLSGALLGELLLIGALGVRGTGAVAGALNLLAAGLALGLARRMASGAEEPPMPATAAPPRGRAAAALLVAAGLAGGTLLTLEVVWVRLMLLWTNANSVAFAVMLAVVLAGIGAGGLVAGTLSRVLERAPALAACAAFLACLATNVCYARLPTVLGSIAPYLSEPLEILTVAVPLMLPTSLLSGALFTLLGAALKARVAGTAQAVGWLTLANTLGALFGALGGGLVLLPLLGVEGALCAASGAYLAVGLLAWRARPESAPADSLRLAVGALAGVALVALLLFPHGLMRNRFAKLAVGRWASVDPRRTVHLAALREGLTETAMYLETRLLDEPVEYRLLTNSISMSGTDLASARYMRLFAWLPLALKPRAQDALLISYGVGTTAKALTDTRSLRSIDVVDISRDILELGRIPFERTGGYPLDDPRVRVHVEDGRFYLTTTAKRYDLITAEPPPPKQAGIVNLYSKEYFALVKARLAIGGLASYWLPVRQLSLGDARSLARAFCDVFEDCTLWSGSGPEWILLGSRGGVPRPSEDDFGAQWRDERVRASMRDVGLETPEQLGVTFLAGAADLRDWIGPTLPLDDDHPYRLSPRLHRQALPEYRDLAQWFGARARFERDAFVSATWPPALRARTLARFASEGAALRVLWTAYGGEPRSLNLLHDVLTSTSSPAPVLWFLAVDADQLRGLERARARGVASRTLDYDALQALAARDYARADRLLEQLGAEEAAWRERALQLRVLALVLANRRSRAGELLADARAWPTVADREGWAWLLRTFDLPDPLGLARPRAG